MGKEGREGRREGGREREGISGGVDVEVAC